PSHKPPNRSDLGELLQKSPRQVSRYLGVLAAVGAIPTHPRAAQVITTKAVVAKSPKKISADHINLAVYPKFSNALREFDPRMQDEWLISLIQKCRRAVQDGGLPPRVLTDDALLECAQNCTPAKEKIRSAGWFERTLPTYVMNSARIAVKQ